ncbi:MAG: hypothetical protein ACI96M_004158 [Candidatus Azotimanducaceae bacterium]|jgi:hypothetical protein
MARLVLLFKMFKSSKARGSQQWLPLFFVYSFCSPVVMAEPLLVDVQSCISIDNNQARLACFDQSATEALPKEAHLSLESAAKKSTPAVNTTSKLPPKMTPRQAQEEFKVVANITEARTIARGKWLLKLDNGQTWQEVEPGRNRYKPGLQVTIESGFMGSYTLQTKGKRARKFRPIY